MATRKKKGEAPSKKTLQEVTATILAAVDNKEGWDTPDLLGKVRKAVETLEGAFEKGHIASAERDEYCRTLTGVVSKGRVLFNKALSDPEGQMLGGRRLNKLLSDLHGRGPNLR